MCAKFKQGPSLLFIEGVSICVYADGAPFRDAALSVNSGSFKYTKEKRLLQIYLYFKRDANPFRKFANSRVKRACVCVFGVAGFGSDLESENLIKFNVSGY